MKVLVIYYSQTGNTKKMAELVVEGVRSEGVDVELKDIGEIKAGELLKVEAIIIGSPTYYGSMAYQIKQLHHK